MYLEDAVDDGLEREARRRGTSKAALIRLAVASHSPALGPTSEAAGFVEVRP